MDDTLTQLVLRYQDGTVSLEKVRNRVMVEAFSHLSRYRRKGEDDVSEFLLGFHGRIEGLLGRFECRGLPFRHFLVRSLRWQWNTFRADRAKQRRQAWLATDLGLGSDDAEAVAEGGTAAWRPVFTLSPVTRRRLVLLALKAAPWLEEDHLEAVSRQTGVELSWLQACQHQLKAATDRRRCRRELLVEKRGEVFYRRLLAEDDARREADPERRQVHERRASLYRSRLASLTRQQRSLSTAPTHLELARVLGMPKGSVDSSLYHLKKEWRAVYDDVHDDHPPRDQQRSQKART